MNSKNKIIQLFNIKYPIIQGGMVWCSGWELASSVSAVGGLGLIGAGSMDTEILRNHIIKTRKVTSKPFGVNIPLLKKDVNDIINLVIKEKVQIVFTSAGNPAIWTQKLKDNGIKVVHVVANTKYTEKAIEAGVDAIVAEGFEAGGHNGREETTTLTLIPLIREITSLPLIAAGGIASGKAMMAAMALGADGVQIGSLFAISKESAAHENFKRKVCEIKEGDTRLILKRLIPVRLITNEFYNLVMEAELKGASLSDLLKLLGSGREKKGIFEGDLIGGELEIGQVSALIKEIKPVSDIIEYIINDYKKICEDIKAMSDKFSFMQ